MRWLRALLGDDDGPPKVSLPAPRREPKPDPALRLPPDPRPVSTVEERSDYCPAERTVDGRARRCGFPKVTGEPTCRRAPCVAWAESRAAERDAKVYPIRARG